MTTTTGTDEPAVSMFSYEAQTGDGQRLTGTIEAADAEVALDRLRAMRLRVVEVQPLSRRPAARPLTGDDFLAFNQQLAQLTAAGMPVEQGLRLIAADVRSRRLRGTIDQLAEEMERGTPLDQAFDKFRANFPPLYGRLIRAGVKSGSLSAVLLGLGRHLDLIQRLRSVLWRSVSYPLVVLMALGFLLSFLGIVVLPKFAEIFADFHIQIPWITGILLALAKGAPVLLIGMLGLLIGGPIVWGILKRLGYSAAIVEWIVVPLPLIGPVLRANLTARWCDAARVGVEAGLDLPAAIELAGDACRSPRLSKDGKAIVDALSAGKSIAAAPTSLLPATVPAAMQFSSGYHDLPATLGSLSEMYQRQAELRLSAIPGILTPVLVLLLAVMIGFVILALMAPLLALIQGISGPTSPRGFRL